MGAEFFRGWELWQKMTLVLGFAIFAVFCAAYGKLIWMNRLVRRQEVIEEEKRTRIEALRENGEIMEYPKAHEIPFGVRAIQSGIQVHGIWISNTKASTPVDNESKPPESSCSDGLMEVSLCQEVDRTMEAPSSTSKSARPRSYQGQPSTYRQQSGSFFLEHSDEKNKTGIIGNRDSYQPSKSSHLRYNSYGGYDEATLQGLEGASLNKTRIQMHQPRKGSRQILSESDLSTADNELNSGISSEADAGFSDHKPAPYSEPATSKATGASNTMVSPALSNMSDPFASPTETTSSSRRPGGQRVGSWYDDMSESQLGDLKSQEPFVPGELHMNKSSRKVNSGFEVLPAGTFGTPIDYKGKYVDRGCQEEDSAEKRISTKLQKKERNSSTAH